MSVNTLIPKSLILQVDMSLVVPWSKDKSCKKMKFN